MAGLAATGCARPIAFGPLGEGSPNVPSIAGVDSATPPRSLEVQLNDAAYVVVLLVAPGHSATLLYPADSATDNHLASGSHRISFEVPRHLIPSDSARRARGADPRETSDRAARPRNRSNISTLPPPLPSTTPVYLLVISAPGPLSWARVVDKTAGVSIPVNDLEALNAMGKAVKSTIPQEPREWAAFYQQISLVQPTK